MDWPFWVLLAMFVAYVGADKVQERMRKNLNKNIHMNQFLCAELGHFMGRRGKGRVDLYHALANIIGENEDAYKIMQGGDILEKEIYSDSKVVH